MFVNIVRWRIPKENSRRQLEIWREMMDYQRAHPEKVSYTRSRFFTSSTEGPAEESWMFLDDYERREDFDRWMKAVREDPDLVRLVKSFIPAGTRYRAGLQAGRALDRGREPQGRVHAAVVAHAADQLLVDPAAVAESGFGYVVTTPGEVRETRPDVILTMATMPEFGSACRVRFGPRVDGPVAMVRGWFAERGRQRFVGSSARAHADGPRASPARPRC